MKSRYLPHATRMALQRQLVCRVNGCEKPRRSKSEAYCEMHYYRKRRTGRLDLRPRPKQEGLPPFVTSRRKMADGYILLRLSREHPFWGQTSRGQIREHRLVFAAHAGTNDHACYWCGETVTWNKIHVDHLNENKEDNSPENLVASCSICNLARGLKSGIGRANEKLIRFRGTEKSISQWARDVGIHPQSLRYRLQHGWSLRAALTTPRGVSGPQAKGRKSFAKATRQIICAQQEWICACGCGESIRQQLIDIDHIVPLALGGSNSTENLQALKKEHHRAKTRRDVKAIAKAKRIARKLAGTWRPNRKRIRSRGFDKTLRRRMDGRVERRE